MLCLKLFNIMGKTIFDKIWDKHTVSKLEDGAVILYIDRHYIHEVTSPQAFAGLNKRGIKVRRPDKTLATCDHNIPTINQHLYINDDSSRIPIEALKSNCKEHGIEMYGLLHKNNGVVHIIGPELGFTRCGMTIVCGDSHTSTHGAFGNIAFGIGTSEVEMVLASQTLIQYKPKQMLIEVTGHLGEQVCAKDLILKIISQLGTSFGTGSFIEFRGDTIERLTMEERMTICNMSIEMGARGAIIPPDEITFKYLHEREYFPKSEFANLIKEWSELKSDWDAVYDSKVSIDATSIEPMVTYGTNPGAGIKISDSIPFSNEESFVKSLTYMGFECGDRLEQKRVDYIFLGSCTNGRIEDFRAFASIVKGKRKHPDVIVWLVPGSRRVLEQIESEETGKILRDAGFEIREPGCSACLAMNEDKVPSGKYCLSTSNRNFEGRQGPGARTILCGPLVAAASSITGVITDPRKFITNEL